MKQLRKIKFTQEGLEKLKEELNKLENTRPDAVKELSRARELGDLSENGLYTAAKARLRSMDSRISRLSDQIKLAQIVKTQRFLVDQGGKEIEYEIVGDFEADPSQNKVSVFSPIGSQLKDKKTGDIVKIQTPGGVLVLKILKTF